MWSTMKRHSLVVVFCIFCAVIEKAVSSEPSTNDIRVLIYETQTELTNDHHAARLLHQIEQVHGLKGIIFGQGDVFDGFGRKFKSLIPILKTLPQDDIVVVSDSRDVLINNPMDSNVYVDSIAKEFRANFDKLTNDYPGAIVVSAEAQCCVAALTHNEPGSYFNSDGTRNATACTSGEPGCLWKGDDKAVPWEQFMKDLSIQRTGGQPVDDMYLNAGLITGKAGDLLRVLNALQLEVEEDDQAVLTDFMYHNSASIVLDYGQSLFGNNRGGLGGIDDGACVFVSPKLSYVGHNRLVHIHTLTTPLFVHSPGGFFECYEALAEELGHNVTQATHRRLQTISIVSAPAAVSYVPPVAPIAPLVVLAAAIVPTPTPPVAGAAAAAVVPTPTPPTVVIVSPPPPTFSLVVPTPTPPAVVVVTSQRKQYRSLSTTQGNGLESISGERRKKMVETRALLRRKLFGDDIKNPLK